MPRRTAQIELPGVTPSRQQRSRETTQALLAAGADVRYGEFDRPGHWNLPLLS